MFGSLDNHFHGVAIEVLDTANNLESIAAAKGGG
jgi:hypothetical protein